MNSTREERFHHRFLIAAFVNIGLALFFLFIGLNRPTIANMRTIDVVHLLATGAWLGAGVVAVVLNFVGPHKG